MPRLFTGLEIPPDVAAELALLRGGLFGARWIEPEDFHITLRFIGDIDDLTAREAASAFDRVHRAPLELCIDGLASFGGRKPRALIATLAQTAPLLEMQAEQEWLMQRLGLAPEGRKYTPHVTLARLRDVSSREVAGYLSARSLFNPLRFCVPRFVLYSSRASSGGGPYVVEQVYPLTARAGMSDTGR
jgi:2'-5' RNA ligase